MHRCTCTCLGTVPFWHCSMPTEFHLQQSRLWHTEHAALFPKLNLKTWVRPYGRVDANPFNSSTHGQNIKNKNSPVILAGRGPSTVRQWMETQPRDCWRESAAEAQQQMMCGDQREVSLGEARSDAQLPRWKIAAPARVALNFPQHTEWMSRQTRSLSRLPCCYWLSLLSTGTLFLTVTEK